MGGTRVGLEVWMVKVLMVFAEEEGEEKASVAIARVRARGGKRRRPRRKRALARVVRVLVWR